MTLVGISVLLLAACVTPGILYAVSTGIFSYDSGIDSSSDSVRSCLEHIQSIYDCSQSEFTLENVSSAFVECVGWDITDPLVYCAPAHIAILPQMGLFQTLALTLQSDIVFYSEPKEYAELFIAKLVEGGASCSGNHCNFEYTRQQYGKTIGFMFLGAILLLLLGVGIATVTIYPSTWMVRARRDLGILFKCRNKRGEKSTHAKDEVEEMAEVNAERQNVHAIIQPFLVGPVDVEANDSPPVFSYSTRNSNGGQLPPVVTHKFTKQYSSFGGAPPKMALNLLGLHVPKGQVLGLLG